MNAAYQQWIADNVTDTHRTCKEVTQRMVLAFPELRRVRGHYVFGLHEEPHWWLVTTSGDIVDPTADQFPPGGVYIEHVGAEPVGRCPNCGGYIYPPHSQICSDVCAEAYTRYLMGGL